jgi:glucose-1-phosphate adenylyltransferase
MGVYIFNWSLLRKYLLADHARSKSRHDFAANVIPAMLDSGEDVRAYRFDGYWRDVGTLESLWASNMDLLRDPPEFVIQEKGKEVFSSAGVSRLFGEPITENRNIFSGSYAILGRVEHSVLSDSVVVENGAEVVESILMPNVYVGKKAKIHRAIIGPGSRIMDGAEIGSDSGVDAFVSDQLCTNGVSLIASWVYVAQNTKLQKNSHVANGVSVESYRKRGAADLFRRRSGGRAFRSPQNGSSPSSKILPFRIDSATSR